MKFSGMVVIEAPHFTAGVVIDRDRVDRVPPILNYMRPWSYQRLKDFTKAHQWKLTEMRERP